MSRAETFSVVLGRLVAARIAAGGAPDAINLTAYADLARRIIKTAEAECPPPEMREIKKGIENRIPECSFIATDRSACEVLDFGAEKARRAIRAWVRRAAPFTQGQMQDMLDTIAECLGEQQKD